MLVLGVLLAASLPFANAQEVTDAVPRVADGFAITALAAGAVLTDLAWGPDTGDGPDLYATQLTGEVQRYDLAWTPAGPLVSGVDTVATGFNSLLGIDVDDDGDIYVASSRFEPTAGRTVGLVTRIDASTGSNTVIVDGVPNGQHNINQLRFDDTGRLWLPVGNPNDHGNGTGTGDTDIFPITGAFLSVDVEAVTTTPATFLYVDEQGERIPDDDLVDHTVNEPFMDLVTVEAWGFRNIFGVAFGAPGTTLEGAVFTATNGADDPASQDTFYQITPGADHGYPFCYAVGRPGATGDDIAMVEAPNSPNPARSCDAVPAPSALLGWHICATGLDLPRIAQPGLLDLTFPETYLQSAYVAECGPFFVHDTLGQDDAASTHNTGHKVVRVALDDDGQATGVHDFVTGLALPTSVLAAPDGSLLIGDAEAIYRIVPTPVAGTLEATGDDLSVPARGPPAPSRELAPSPPRQDQTPATDGILALSPIENPTGPPAPIRTTGQTFNVATLGFQFLPAVLTVPVGSTVVWSGDFLPHTVTTSDEQCLPLLAPDACRSNVPDDGDDDPHTHNGFLAGRGSTTEITFSEPGTYPYFCAFHPGVGMTGTVVVV